MQQPSSSNSQANKDKDHDYAIDFILSILFASLQSFKGDSLLKPLPNFVVSVEQLVNFHDQIGFPPIRSMVNSAESLNFIDWTTLLAGKLEVKPFDKKCFLDLAGLSNVKQSPQFIVKLKNPRMSSKFEDLTETHGNMIGFHGTHTENVFSILQNGLVGHLNTRALYGSGTYLSSDIDVALSFARQGKSWPSSRICRNMTCVLMCKVINSDQVKQGKEKLSGISFNNNPLPHNYYVVKNNDHVAVTHVLIYSSKQRIPSSLKAESRLLVFIRCYGFVLLYGLVIVFICLSSNGVLKKWIKKFM